MAGWHAIAYSTCLTYYILHLGYHTKSNTSLQLVHCQSVIVTLMSPACPVYPVHLSPLFVPTQAQNSCTHRPITRHTATPALQCPSGLQTCNCVLSYNITRCAILTHTHTHVLPAPVLTLVVSLLLQAWACKIWRISSLGHGQPADGCC